MSNLGMNLVIVRLPSIQLVGFDWFFLSAVNGLFEPKKNFKRYLSLFFPVDKVWVENWRVAI